MTASASSDVLFTIPETDCTRRTMRVILVNSQAGLAQTGILLLPLLAGALVVWHHARPSDPGPYAASALILVSCMAAFVQWARWWASWRKTPCSWEVRRDGIYRAGRRWALWSEISTLRIHRALLGSRVAWSALRISAPSSNANMRWGTPYIPIDPAAVDEHRLLAICRDHAALVHRDRTLQLIHPWMMRLVVALFVFTVFATLIAVRLAVHPR